MAQLVQHERFDLALLGAEISSCSSDGFGNFRFGSREQLERMGDCCDAAADGGHGVMLFGEVGDVLGDVDRLGDRHVRDAVVAVLVRDVDIEVDLGHPDRERSEVLAVRHTSTRRLRATEQIDQFR